MTIYVAKLEPDEPAVKGYYWSVSSAEGSQMSEGGTETTRLKAWRKACAVARRDFGPVS